MATTRRRGANATNNTHPPMGRVSEFIADLFDLGPPPYEIQNDWRALDQALDNAIPPKTLDRNLLIATWNIRHFDGLTEKWLSAWADRPKRDVHALVCITEIVRRFDVVALQEVKGSFKALRHMMKLLGPDWGMILTDVNQGAQGNNERLAFVFDLRRVRPSGLAAELVVVGNTNRVLKEAVDPAHTPPFARTPYAVAFNAGHCTFILVTLHVIYGKGAEERRPELQQIARWMADWAEEVSSWGQNLIVLGDFNIDRFGDPAYEAFTRSGLRPPQELRNLPRTIADGNLRPGASPKFYDQIAWFADTQGLQLLSLRYSNKAGHFDFISPLTSTDRVLAGRTKAELSARISDHYPLWAEFMVGGR